MQKANFPGIRYSLPSFVAVGPRAVTAFAMEQIASQGEWWAKIPWDGIALFGVAWLFGLLYADLWNKDSQLKNWFRWLTRLFDVEGFWPAHKVEDSTEYLCPTFRIRFVRNVKKASVQLEIFGCIKQGAPQQHISTRLVTEATILKGDEETHTIAKLPLSRQDIPDLWGPLPGCKDEHFIGGSKNLISIKATGRILWVIPITQKERLYIEGLPKDHMTFGRVYMLTEADNLFEVSYGAR